MASISISKVKEINGGCGNGFQLDIQYYVCYKEYALEKYEQIEGNDYKKYRLSYREHFDKVTNEYGSTYSKYNGTYDIVLNINKSKREDKIIITNDLGTDILLEKGITRKSIKKLQEWSNKLDMFNEKEF